ncbi:hypothetical protein Q5752_003964 [Cryptotrichosporon argae]
MFGPPHATTSRSLRRSPLSSSETLDSLSLPSSSSSSSAFKSFPWAAAALPSPSTPDDDDGAYDFEPVSSPSSSDSDDADDGPHFDGPAAFDGASRASADPSSGPARADRDHGRAYEPAPRARAARTPRLAPLTPLVAPAPSGLPKSQPLSRALFARMAAGDAAPAKVSKKLAPGTKLIVPTKTFRTTFELGLSSTEIARKQ